MKPVLRVVKFRNKESPPTRGAWIETLFVLYACAHLLSPPTRGAWIETLGHEYDRPGGVVAPHAGGVD